MVMFVFLYKVVLTLTSVGRIVKRAIQSKATEQSFPEVLLIMLYKVVLTFEYVNKIVQYVRLFK